MAAWDLLKHFGHLLVHHLPRSLYVATVIASGVHILNSNNLPLELPATALLAGVAHVYVPQRQLEFDARKHMAVVEVDEQRFRHRDYYNKTSPLDRCTLRDDLRRLLKNGKVRVLAIDFDMSPIDPLGYQEAWKSLERQEKTLDQISRRQRCQYELEQFLSEASQRVSIIAISPLAPTEGRESGRQWDDPVHFPFIKFGIPNLEVRFGMVHDYEFPPNGYAGKQSIPFAELITRELCTASMASVANHEPSRNWLHPPPKACAQILSESTPTQQAPTNAKFETYPISHYEARYIHDEGFPISPSDPCFDDTDPISGSGQERCDIRVVVFGGTYSGPGDRFLTPVGEMSGLQLQAVIAAQVRSHTWHGWGFLGDILLGGLVFGPLVHAMWARYYRQRTGSAKTHSWVHHRKTAYVWLILLGAAYLFIAIVVAIWAAGLYANRGIWISPLPMALAMMFEAAVTGSVHAAVDKVEHDAEEARTTISALERTVSELRSTQSGDLEAQPLAQDAAPDEGTPCLACLPRTAAIVLIVWVGGGLILELI